MTLVALLAACNDLELAPETQVPPVAAILEPAEQEHFSPGEGVSLLGSVADGNGLADIQSVTWSSDHDGVLGEPLLPDSTGIVRFDTTLTAGVHTILLTALDTTGQTGADSVVLVVEAPTLPTDSYGPGVPSDTAPPPPTDVDADGATATVDCNDADASLNLLDEDEDGSTTCAGDCDDFDPTVEALDQDSDAWSTCLGDCNDLDNTLDPTDTDLDGVSNCAGDCDDANAALHPFDGDLDGLSPCAGDCDDTTAARSPLNAELCNNGIDDDCDLVVDGMVEGCNVCGDGWIDALEACDDGNVASGDGCNSTCTAIECDAASTGGDAGFALIGTTCVWRNDEVESRSGAISRCQAKTTSAYLIRWLNDPVLRDTAWITTHPGCDTCRVWNGLQKVGGVWTWDGEGPALPGDLNWRSGEPSGDGDCVEWGGSGGNILNDISCSNSRDSVCERPRAGIPR